MTDRSRDIERLADLAVRFGANVQPGQILVVGAEVGQESLVRAIARAAYEHGAKFVDATYFDMYVKRERLLHAAEDTLGFIPSWYSDRLLAIGDQRCARIGLSGTAHPHALDGVDPQRAALDQLPFLPEAAKVVNDRTTNWCAIAGPSPGWASLVFPDASPAEAEDRLWEQVLHVLRLDEDDPVEAWRARSETLKGAAERMTSRRFDAVHFSGPGTDLTVGLLPSSKWMAAEFSTLDGIVHMPNLPTEEIFTTPDPERVDGEVRSTKPLELHGTIIRGLRVRFEGGRAVAFDADENGDALAGYAQHDAGASRLGEVALVDAEGRIGPLDTVFYDTLLDENAASHIALGSAYRFTVEDEAEHPRANVSGIHVDFMIGGPDVDVTGITREGERVPVLLGGRWQI
ncbi:MAG TPA: aminopeptidase [Solirubrobacteraceae bacterium]|jgi:aminopeptidase